MPLSLAAILGLLLGSFYSVCASRYGTRATILRPARSQCPQCGHQLGIRENIPLLSYMIQRGRCRHCATRIPIFYPVIELCSATWATLTALHTADPIQWGVLMIVGGICIVAAAIDLRTFLLPDILTGTGAVVVLVASWMGWLPVPFTDALVGGAIGAAVLWGLAALFKKARNIDGLGLGDVKFMGMLGALTGWQHLSFLFLLASTSALLFALVTLRGQKNMRTIPIPFGPFLAFGAAITVLYGEQMQALLY
ncbi:MAG: A24 family peptidase [Desulfovibrionales bacterium]|nr:A24 family peptidase [Desulfovibrionales bacterium]